MKDVTVTLSTQRAAVVVDDDNDNNDGHHNTNYYKDLAVTCQAAVQQAGYTCQVRERTANNLQQSAQEMATSQTRERHAWRRLFVISAAALVPMAVLHYTHNMGGNGVMTVVFLFATIVQFGVGARFYRAARQGWQHGRSLGMDFLICLGTTASYVYSVIIYLAHILLQYPMSSALQPTFMTGVMLLTFVSMGKWLEAIAKGNTCMAIQSLMEMQPATAHKLIQVPTDIKTNNKYWQDLGSLVTETVDTADIVPGDYVKVLPGERVPADGTLVALSAPQAFLDESSFSGEPFAVTKRVGDVVLGGTVNQSTAVLISQVTAAGRDSLLAQIVTLVEDAQRHKAPIQLFADQVAAVFAPMVVTLAAITLVFWWFIGSTAENESWEQRLFVALMSAISVVVVACPCALGLGKSRDSDMDVLLRLLATQ